MKFHNRAFWAVACLMLLAIFTLPLVIPRQHFIAPERPSAHVMLKTEAGHGSAVHIGGGIYISAGHVVAGTAGFEFVNDSGESAPAELLWSNSTYDIALLRTAEASFTSALPLACEVPDKGSSIVLHGNPGQFHDVAARGFVGGGVHELPSWKEAVIVDVTTVPGMSGGAVVSDSGAVVGITVGVQTHGYGLTGFGIVVPGRVVCMLMGRGA